MSIETKIRFVEIRAQDPEPPDEVPFHVVAYTVAVAVVLMCLILWLVNL